MHYLSHVNCVWLYGVVDENTGKFKRKFSWRSTDLLPYCGDFVGNGKNVELMYANQRALHIGFGDFRHTVTEQTTSKYSADGLARQFKLFESGELIFETNYTLDQMLLNSYLMEFGSPWFHWGDEECDMVKFIHCHIENYELRNRFIANCDGGARLWYPRR